jgi:putative membrane protein
MLCPLAFIACSYLLLIDKHQAFYLVVAVFCLLSSMIYFRWKRWGIAVDSNYIYLRKGMFGVNYYCFPRYKVQQISFVQSWFLKRQHLASVNFILACGKQSIAFIDEQMAYNLMDSTLYEVESTKKSWM